MVQMLKMSDSLAAMSLSPAEEKIIVTIWSLENVRYWEYNREPIRHPVILPSSRVWYSDTEGEGFTPLTVVNWLRASSHSLLPLGEMLDLHYYLKDKVSKDIKDCVMWQRCRNKQSA